MFALREASLETRRYELEWQTSKNVRVHECFLKEAHSVASPTCHDYAAWEFDDIYWQGHSGPAVCGQWKNADACVKAARFTF